MVSSQQIRRGIIKTPGSEHGFDALLTAKWTALVQFRWHKSPSLFVLLLAATLFGLCGCAVAPEKYQPVQTTGHAEISQWVITVL
jgi:hypothetical protein